MMALIQRVKQASVCVDAQTIGRIGPGLLVFLCAQVADGKEQADKLLQKILKLRIFNDANDKMNLSVQDVGGGLLIVSQFTLAADVWSGNRPGFSAAADPVSGRELYDYFLVEAGKRHPHVASGQFGANMQVHLINDGPVTIPVQVPASN